MATPIPNIPHHFDRRPTDYPRHKTPKFGWRDDNGKPIHAIDEQGNPICGRHKSESKTPCMQTVLCANGRCKAPGHGGNAPGGPPKHGRYSQFIPTRLAASYESITGDDVLYNVRENIRVILAMTEEKLAEMGEESGAELWEKANKAFDAAKDAILDREETALYLALDQLGTILKNGTGVQQREREVLDLMARSSKLTKVELFRLQKMDQFMTVEQSLANQAHVLAILKRHVEPSVLAKVAFDMGAATYANRA